MRLVSGQRNRSGIGTSSGHCSCKLVAMLSLLDALRVLMYLHLEGLSIVGLIQLKIMSRSESESCDVPETLIDMTSSLAYPVRSYHLSPAVWTNTNHLPSATLTKNN